MPAPKHKFKAVIWEGVLVAVVGMAAALAANALSPRGLVLTRDYFPGAIPNPADKHATAVIKPRATGANTNRAATATLAARLKTKGLLLVDSNQVAELMRDPAYEQQLIVFIDARDDAHYQAGHIPGAHQFDHYRAEKYLATVLPVCQMALQIVVYCNGGGCEDSEFAALTLRQAGIRTERLFVYGGGFAEWITNGLPVEVGGRNSGTIRRTKP